MRQIVVALSVLLALVCLAAPASARQIVSVGILTPDNSGVWRTGVSAAIGITDLGGTGNPFHNDLNSGAIIPATGISSGTYLAFLGYETYWPTGTATLTIWYDDDTTRSATFDVGSLTNLGDWVLLSGDAGLHLGGGGYAVTPDRVGTYGAPNICAPDGLGHCVGDGIPDIVLRFSDTGPLGIPEPSTFVVLASGLSLFGLRRRLL